MSVILSVGRVREFVFLFLVVTGKLGPEGENGSRTAMVRRGGRSAVAGCAGCAGRLV